jgi:lambda repressor-like predicted transcriptional regulator
MSTPSLVDQLVAAWRRSGWTMAELRRRSGLPIGTQTLSRKLLGDHRKGRRPRVKLSTEECEVLARALGVILVIVPEVPDELLARRRPRNRKQHPSGSSAADPLPQGVDLCAGATRGTAA